MLDDALAQELSERLADVFRTADASDVLADDVFLDGNPPLWPFQLQGRDSFDAWIKGFMPDGTETTVVRTIPSVTGFVTEFAGRHQEDGEDINRPQDPPRRGPRRPHRRSRHLPQRRLERRTPSPPRRRNTTHPPLNRGEDYPCTDRIVAGLPATTLDDNGATTAGSEVGDQTARR